MRNLRRALAVSACWATLCLSVAARAENYAIMFVGGIEPQQNYERYYIETLRFYDQLTDTLNYKPEYVWVLAADGTNSAADKNTGT